MKQQTGLFLHVHHDILLEWCHNYDERVAFIRNEKPKEEQETRLRLFKPFKGKLPQEVVKAVQELNKARQELNKARQENNKAWQEYDKVLNDNKELIEALHKAECPNCPWN